jgi:hypothetical protein
MMPLLKIASCVDESIFYFRTQILRNRNSTNIHISSETKVHGILCEREVPRVLQILKTLTSRLSLNVFIKCGCKTNVVLFSLWSLISPRHVRYKRSHTKCDNSLERWLLHCKVHRIYYAYSTVYD